MTLPRVPGSRGECGVRRPHAGVPGLAVAACLLLFSCGIPARPSYATWESRGEPSPAGPVSAREAEPGPGTLPMGATVSHHLLAGSYIDDLFMALRAARSVDVFIIISPLHFNQGYARVSLTDRSWRTGSGMVRTDEGLARALARRLAVDLDPTAFNGEHGVSTLIPFIARRFPCARVVAIACRGEPPPDKELARRLSDAILPLFKGPGSRKLFLLVSTDFSHHGDEKATAARDALARLYFERPAHDTRPLAGCDNPLGLYVLTALAESFGCGASVLHHTTSLRIAPGYVDPADVTSYFFSFMCRPVGSRDGRS